MQVGRQPFRPWQELMYTYSFDGWRQVTGTEIDVNSFGERGLDDLLLADDGSTIRTEEDWQAKRASIHKRMLCVLGELPAVHVPPGLAPSNLRQSPSGLVKAELPITDSLIGHITYKEGAEQTTARGDLFTLLCRCPGLPLNRRIWLEPAGRRAARRARLSGRRIRSIWLRKAQS